VWLKGLGPVRHTRNAFEFTGEEIDIVREGDVDVVQWVPAEGCVPVRLRTIDGDETGHAEPGFADHEVGDVVQFERIGFARIDRLDDEAVAYFAHP
jgi:glutamyl-tRNA synthetase